MDLKILVTSAFFSLGNIKDDRNISKRYFNVTITIYNFNFA